MSTEYKDIMSRLNKVIKMTVEDSEVFIELKPEDSLTESGLDSVSFIKLVVLIETEFDFNFDEYGMFFNNFKTLDELRH